MKTSYRIAPGLHVSRSGDRVVLSQRGHVAWQIAQLGVLFTVETVAIFGAIGWYAGSVGERLARRPAIGAWLDRLAGAIFVALGLRLAVVV